MHLKNLFLLLHSLQNNCLGVFCKVPKNNTHFLRCDFRYKQVDKYFGIFGSLSPFIPIFHFHTPWKSQKNIRFSDFFRAFSWGIVMEYWAKMANLHKTWIFWTPLAAKWILQNLSNLYSIDSIFRQLLTKWTRYDFSYFLTCSHVNHFANSPSDFAVFQKRFMAEFLFSKKMTKKKDSLKRISG